MKFLYIFFRYPTSLLSRFTATFGTLIKTGKSPMRVIFIALGLCVLLTSAVSLPVMVLKARYNAPRTPYESYTKSNPAEAYNPIKVGQEFEGGIVCAFAVIEKPAVNKCCGFVCAPTDQPAANWLSAQAECSALRIGGYDNWRLPTRQEIELMRDMKMKGIGNFSDDYYWSSSESYDYKAYYEVFTNGFQDYAKKSYKLRVRAVRSF